MLATLALPAAAPLQAPRTRTVQVRSADELRQALRDARREPLVLDASRLDCVLRVDEERRQLEVQGAMTWASLAACVGARGRSLAAWSAATPLPATVGEAVSLDAPGPDGAPLAACIEALALVTLDGEMRRVDRAHPAGLFRNVIGGQGVFGLLYSVTLRLDALLAAADRAQPPVELDLAGTEALAGCDHEVHSLVPPERVEAFVAAVRALAQERRFALRHLSVRRLQAGETAVLGWASRNWAGVSVRFRLPATLGASVQGAEIRRLIHAAAIALGGSFPVYAARDASRAQLDACYPQLPAFLAEKRRFDPGERLQNAWYRCVTAGLRHRTCESRWSNA